MDRNNTPTAWYRASDVALRKESVDRNPNAIVHIGMIAWSLSARRAWIEIWGGFSECIYANTSLSARRAWIEIFLPIELSHERGVALRKESVDRNLWWGVRKAVGSLSLSARRAWIEIAPRWRV